MHTTQKLLLLTTLLLVPTNALAQAEPSDEDAPTEQPQTLDKKPAPLNVGLLVGYGQAFGTGTLTDLNPYSLGIGVQADYQLGSGIVLGVGLDGFLGQSVPIMDPNNPLVHSERSARYILAHGRIGYNITMHALGSRIDLRPSVWLGVAEAFVPPDAVRAPGGVLTALLVAPGLSFHYAIGSDGFYVGEDIRLSLPIGAYTRTGLLILFTAGTHV